MEKIGGTEKARQIIDAFRLGSIKANCGNPYDGMGKYFALPTPGELAAHLKEAILWTKDRKQVYPAKRVIIYEWNEHDEGGWLCPTIDENDQFNASRLKALKKVLKSIN